MLNLEKIKKNLNTYLMRYPITLALVPLLTSSTAWDNSFLFNGQPSDNIGGEYATGRTASFIFTLIFTAILATCVGSIVDRLSKEPIPSANAFFKSLSPKRSPYTYLIPLCVLGLWYLSHNFLLKGNSFDPGNNDPNEAKSHFTFTFIATTLAMFLIAYSADRHFEYQKKQVSIEHFSLLSPNPA